MTVALATVWLIVGLVGGTVTLRLFHDQYSPASLRHPSGIQREQTEDWKDHDLAEDQPLDLWISSRRSISAEGTSRILQYYTVSLVSEIKRPCIVSPCEFEEQCGKSELPH